MPRFSTRAAEINELPNVTARRNSTAKWRRELVRLWSDAVRPLQPASARKQWAGFECFSPVEPAGRKDSHSHLRLQLLCNNTNCLYPGAFGAGRPSNAVRPRSALVSSILNSSSQMGPAVHLACEMPVRAATMSSRHRAGKVGFSITAASCLVRAHSMSPAQAGRRLGRARSWRVTGSLPGLPGAVPSCESTPGEGSRQMARSEWRGGVSSMAGGDALQVCDDSLVAPKRQRKTTV